MGVKAGDAKHDAAGGLLDVLTPERARKLRADAWRYVRRIDARTARRIWRACREREPGMRYAAKRDAAERPIILALEAHGFEVWALDQPCDLAVRRSSWPPGRVQLLEVKTPHGKAGRPRLDKRQQCQANFVASSGTPIVTTPVEALNALEQHPWRRLK